LHRGFKNALLKYSFANDATSSVIPVQNHIAVEALLDDIPIDRDVTAGAIHILDFELTLGNRFPTGARKTNSEANGIRVALPLTAIEPHVQTDGSAIRLVVRARTGNPPRQAS
jgi:hypothetical protein